MHALGRYIVADPAICHGKPTFIDTRILVSDVLEQVASGMTWESIVDVWRGDVSKEAIADAVRLVSEAHLLQDLCDTTLARPGEGAHLQASRACLGAQCCCA